MHTHIGGTGGGPARDDGDSAVRRPTKTPAAPRAALLKPASLPGAYGIGWRPEPASGFTSQGATRWRSPGRTPGSGPQRARIAAASSLISASHEAADALYRPVDAADEKRSGGRAGPPRAPAAFDRLMPKSPAHRDSRPPPAPCPHLPDRGESVRLYQAIAGHGVSPLS